MLETRKEGGTALAGVWGAGGGGGGGAEKTPKPEDQLGFNVGDQIRDEDSLGLGSGDEHGKEELL